MGIHLGACNEVFDTLLLAVSLFAFLFWLLLPRGMWEGWLCGYGMLGASLLAFTLWRTSRELRMRVAFERVASELSEENASLKASSAQLKGDLVMLQDTIGALGDRGADWLGQLRVLYAAQKRENDRHGLLLRGHARIVLLQLIQHFDSDRNLRLNVSELAAAEAFLAAGFPDIDIKHLESKAASSGVTIADLEPLLLMHLQNSSEAQQKLLVADPAIDADIARLTPGGGGGGGGGRSGRKPLSSRLLGYSNRPSQSPSKDLSA